MRLSDPVSAAFAEYRDAVAKHQPIKAEKGMRLQYLLSQMLLEPQVEIIDAIIQRGYDRGNMPLPFDTYGR